MCGYSRGGRGGRHRHDVDSSGGQRVLTFEVSSNPEVCRAHDPDVFKFDGRTSQCARSLTATQHLIRGRSMRLERYVHWREECIEVRKTNQRWLDCALGRGLAYAEYIAAMDREEQAARAYRSDRARTRVENDQPQAEPSGYVVGAVTQNRVIPQRPPRRCGIWRFCPSDHAAAWSAPLPRPTVPRSRPWTKSLAPRSRSLATTGG